VVPIRFLTLAVRILEKMRDAMSNKTISLNIIKRDNKEDEATKAVMRGIIKGLNAETEVAQREGRREGERGRERELSIVYFLFSKLCICFSVYLLFLEFSVFSCLPSTCVSLFCFFPLPRLLLTHACRRARLPC
jgi:hypothetical protein